LEAVVNRPFYAIGVLVAFLAVALLAVGLSSRPTQHQTTARGGNHADSARRALGGPAYLLALPTGEEPLAQAIDPEAGEGESAGYLPCEQPCFAYGCGLDRNTGLVYSIQPITRCRFRATTIAVAADPNSLLPASSIDCRAHYDRKYDAVLYGEGIPAARNGRPTESVAAPQTAFPTEFGDNDPTLRLFFSLAGRGAAGPALRLKSARRWRLELLQIARGLANQTWESATRLGVADRWQRIVEVVRPAPATDGPSWADYEAWIASLQPGVADRDTPPAENATWIDQPWRQVLQFAVSWLNHAAKTLDSMAERLGSRAEPQANDRVGVRGTEEAPF
jgi:hypothetical protein